MLKVCSNASALGGESCTSSPMKRTGAVLKEVASAARAGASRLHGAHHEPQKLSTTTLPRCAARLNFAPVSVVPLTCGAAGRTPCRAPRRSRATRGWPASSRRHSARIVAGGSQGDLLQAVVRNPLCSTRLSAPPPACQQQIEQPPGYAPATRDPAEPDGSA